MATGIPGLSRRSCWGWSASWAGEFLSYMAGLPLELRFDWDRLLISVLFGASLLTTGLIDYLFKDDRRKEIFICLIIALAIGMQFQQSNSFRRDWENQKSFFWQLAWRAPALKSGTALVTERLPLQYEADLQLSAPLNLVYEPDAEKLSYMLLYTKNRLGGSILPNLSPGQPMEYRYRTVKFDGNTSNMIILQQPGDGCLHLMDPNYVSEETYPGLPENLAKSIDLSNINQVEQNGDNMAVPSRYFGPEPARDWCYYFERAELARQYGDWEEVPHELRIRQRGRLYCHAACRKPGIYRSSCPPGTNRQSWPVDRESHLQGS